MILVFNENYTLKYCVSSNTPQKLLDGEFEVVINDLDSIYAIENGATVTWNSTINEVEIDYSTVEVITDESYIESLESEIAEICYDNMLKDARISEHDKEIAEAFNMSAWFDRIKQFYDRNLWTKEQVKDGVRTNTITKEEYEQIVGEPFEN